MPRLLSGCRHASAQGAVIPAAMLHVQRSDLGGEKVACVAAENLRSVFARRRLSEDGLAQTKAALCCG
jgi:hypothetical protein